jgi:TrmH family RNA methyltransferase
MRSKEITSLANTRVKEVVHLRHRKKRDETGLTVVEGVREVTRALEAGIVFKELYLCRPILGQGEEILSTVEKLETKNVSVFETTETVFSKMSYGDRSEGILAVCEMPVLGLKDFPARPSFFVVLEAVEKPGNLGAVLRTCDGAGVDGVIICDGKTDVYNPNVVRVSLGTVFAVKTVVASNEETLEFLKAKNIKICATLPQAKAVYAKTDLTGPVAVVMGSEQDGLTDFWTNHADLKVRIPMHGKADSFNVSVSAAILLYEIIRQRNP